MLKYSIKKRNFEASHVAFLASFPVFLLIISFLVSLSCAFFLDFCFLSHGGKVPDSRKYSEQLYLYAIALILMIIYSSETREKKRRCCEWKSKSNRKWFFSPERYIVSRSNRICVEAFFNSVGRQTTKNTGISIKEAESEGLIVSISPMAQKSYNPSSCNNFLQSVSVYTHVHASQKVWPLHTRGEENFHSSLWYFYYIVPFCLHISTDRFFLQDHPHTRKYNMNTQNMKNSSTLLSASIHFLCI